MNLRCQLARLEQIAEAWQLLRPTTRIHLQVFDLEQYFGSQGDIQDFSIFVYCRARLISRKTVVRERWPIVLGQPIIDALEIVRLPTDSQSASDEVGTLLGLHEEPRRVMNLEGFVFGTTVDLSARLLTMLPPAGCVITGHQALCLLPT